MRPCFVVMLIMLSGLLLWSCSKSINEKQIRIGIIKPSIDHLPLSIAMEKQYLDVTQLKIVNFTSGWEVQEALTAGKIDLAIMPFTYAWTAVSKGYKLKTVSCLERETDGIVASPEFKKVTDLSNHKIGLLRASSLETLMQDTAKRNKFSYEAVYFRTPIEMIAALKAQKVDAIVCYVPLIQKMGVDYQVLHWFSETYPSHPCCDLVATDAILKTRPTAINKIQKGLNLAIKDINEPSEATFKLIERLFGLDALQAVEALRHTRFDNSISQQDKQFEQFMMQSFLSNDYLQSIPAMTDVFVK